MTVRKANHTVAAALAAAALLLAAAGTATADHAVRSPTAGVSKTLPSGAKPNYGYGSRWCYWHPYQCRYH